MKSLYGNMTHEEKKLNKDDLNAYKSYDRNQYAMLPGFKNTSSVGRAGTELNPTTQYYANKETFQSPPKVNKPVDGTQNYRRFGNKSVDNINVHGILGATNYYTSDPYQIQAAAPNRPGVTSAAQHLNFDQN